MTPPTTLEDWLAHCERLHPRTVERPLEAVRALLHRLDIHFEAPVITVAGTNGKGSTCAMLESIALQAGYRVGLYTKPHLVHFEERCRLNGNPIAAQDLLPHFAAVEAARQQAGSPPLSWFAFTTLVILRALSQQALDLVILEVGLGGRLDPVNLVDPDCSVITSIDLDHMELLGPDRESIGREKAHIMRPGRPAVVSDPVPPRSVVEFGEALGADLWLVGRDFNHAGDRQQWSWSGRGRRYNALGYPALRGANQLLNAAGVLAAFEALRSRLPITAQAVRTGLALVELPGRFQIVPGQPTLVLDVAHNAQSVATLAVNLDQMGFHPRTHAVFGAMRDKDIPAILARMAPLVDAWHFCGLDSARAATAEELLAAWQSCPPSPRGAGVPAPTASTHTTPPQALAAAMAQADPADRIVVFGSFQT
ncbi:MAG: bifunctional folylpolyglutamate synthase/dihydrofolate synthase, partial [Rubrivivax sp.]